MKILIILLALLISTSVYAKQHYAAFTASLQKDSTSGESHIKFTKLEHPELVSFPSYQKFSLPINKDQVNACLNDGGIIYPDYMVNNIHNGYFRVRAKCRKPTQTIDPIIADSPDIPLEYGNKWQLDYVVILEAPVTNPNITMKIYVKKK